MTFEQILDLCDWYRISKDDQLYRKHNRVLALRYVTMMLIRLGVIFHENFTEDKLCCQLP